MATPAGDDTQIRLGRNWIRQGDPCRWRNHRGLFRFDGIDKPAAGDTPAVLRLFGPASSSKPKQRYVYADQVIRVTPSEGLRALVASR